MSASGYEVFEDPYCYKGTFVLKNKRGIRDAAMLEQFELEMTAARAEEELPNGRFGTAHYRAVHRHLFQDVYGWAGRYRTVRTAKGANVFCYPEHIGAQMEQAFARLKNAPFKPGARAGDFVAASAAFLGEINAIHPFREGNGRAQLAFLHLLGLRARHPMDLARIRPEPMLAAMIKSFDNELSPLKRELTSLLV